MEDEAWITVFRKKHIGHLQYTHTHEDLAFTARTFTYIHITQIHNRMVIGRADALGSVVLQNGFQELKGLQHMAMRQLAVPEVRPAWTYAFRAPLVQSRKVLGEDGIHDFGDIIFTSFLNEFIKDETTLLGIR